MEEQVQTKPETTKKSTVVPKLDALSSLNSGEKKATLVHGHDAETFQIMDERDTEQIVAEARGGYFDKKFVYKLEFETKDGRKQKALGLSIHGVDEICRIMGGIQTSTSEPRLVVEEVIHPVTKAKLIEYYYVCTAVTIDIISGNRTEAHYREKKYKQKSNNSGVYEDTYAYQISQSKARRNSRYPHLPKEAVRQYLLDYDKVSKEGIEHLRFGKKYLDKFDKDRAKGIANKEGSAMVVFEENKKIVAPTTPQKQQAKVQKPVQQSATKAEPEKKAPEKQNGKVDKAETVEAKVEKAQEVQAEVVDREEQIGEIQQAECIVVEEEKKEEQVEPAKELSNEERLKIAAEKIKNLLEWMGMKDSKERSSYLKNAYKITWAECKEQPIKLEAVVPLLERLVETEREKLRKAYFGKASEVYKTSEEAKEAMKKSFKLKSFNDATKEQLEAAISEIEGIKEGF